MNQYRCLQDCEAQWTGDPKDCHCAERLDRLYELEMEARVDRAREAWVNDDDGE